MFMMIYNNEGTQINVLVKWPICIYYENLKRKMTQNGDPNIFHSKYHKRIEYIL